MRFQRAVQLVTLAAFLVLILLNSFPPPGWLALDSFLRLDPLIAAGTMVAARAAVTGLAWAFLILALAFLLGRFFCGHLCPMGTTIDLLDRVSRRKRARGAPQPQPLAGGSRQWKYTILAVLLGAALAGYSAVFMFSPLSLMTRFYSLVLFPLAVGALQIGLEAVRPLGAWFGWEGLRYAQLGVPVFSTALFTGCLLAAIFLLGSIAPRFWCRCLCPAGAMIALCARKPILGRRVSEDCTRCGRCAAACPMGAIPDDFFSTRHQECVVCLKCRDICPVNAISFGKGAGAGSQGVMPDLGRRRWIGAGLTGLAAGALTAQGLGQFFGDAGRADLRSSRLVRPPGALPEGAFQARCVRCGACIKGCATNTLQAVWFEAGLAGIWTPKVTARLAACEQFCTLCGEVCPTGAIRPLPLEEKLYAKIGTARVLHSRCIAWEQEKTCLICDEICPYNAIASRFIPGHAVTVPFIQEDRCNGCGYCENKCPVQGESAIIVEIQGEVRLAEGSFRKLARERGLVLEAPLGAEESVMVPRPGGNGVDVGGAGGPAQKLPPGFELGE